MRRILLAAFASLLLLAGCSPRGASRIDPALASLIPADSIMLAGAKLEAIRRTPLYQRFLASDAGFAGLNERDIYEVLMVSDGRRTAALARGKFAPADGSEPKFDLPGAAREGYKGYTILISGDRGLTFMNPSVAVAGNPEAIRWIIDQRSSSSMPKPLAQMLAGIPAANQVWLVAAGVPALAAAGPLASPMARNLKNALSVTESVTAAADLRAGLNGAAELICRTERNASDLAEGLKLLVSFARLSSPDQAEIKQAWNKITIAQHERTVRLSVALTENELNGILAERHR